MFFSVSSISSLFSGMCEIAVSRLSIEPSRSRARPRAPYFFAADTSRSLRLRKFSLSAINRKSLSFNAFSSAASSPVASSAASPSKRSAKLRSAKSSPASGFSRDCAGSEETGFWLSSGAAAFSISA